jgi:hypothetical protein
VGVVILKYNWIKNMETCCIRLSPDEVLEILKKYYQAKDARVVSHSGCRGMSWEGLNFIIYDKPYLPVNITKEKYEN